jgi:hypothetical protein
MSSKNLNFQTVKDWFSLVVSIIACIAGVIFWIQQSSNDKIQHVEKEIVSLRSDIDKIRDNNTEILRIIGRLEGKLERRKRQ